MVVGTTGITSRTNTSQVHHGPREKLDLGQGEKVKNSSAALHKGRALAEEEPEVSKEEYFSNRRDYKIDPRQRI